MMPSITVLPSHTMRKMGVGETEPSFITLVKAGSKVRSSTYQTYVFNTGPGDILVIGS